MDEDEKEKEKRDASEVSENKKKEHVKAFFAGLRALLQRHGYPVKGDRAKTQKEGKVNPETSREISNWIPSFHSYEDFNRLTLHSLDGFMIIVSTDGVIIYVAENISSLLGHLPDDIVGKKLLSLLPDEEKNEVYRRIAIKLPLSMSGKHINFCCRLKRGDAEHYSHPAYECVKFLLTIKDISDEPLALLRSFFPSQPSSAELPLEDRFYLVGTVCMLRAQILRELFAIKEAGKDGPPMLSDSPEGHLSSDHRLFSFSGSSQYILNLHLYEMVLSWSVDTGWKKNFQHSKRMEVPGPGTESEPQLQPTPQLQQCWVLNPLHQDGISSNSNSCVNTGESASWL